MFKALLPSFPAAMERYFDVAPDAPLADFEREARRRPMFRVDTASSPADR